ncbi:MAG: hypothetical protein ACLRMX_06795 [Lachnospira eligens]
MEDIAMLRCRREIPMMISEGQRFHAAALTAKYTPKGADFKNVPDVTIVYISEYDVLKNNQTVTHVTRCMKNDESYVPVKDGEI